MRTRAFSLVAAVALLAAACGSASEVQFQPQALAYGYEAGTDLSYEFSMDMDMRMDMNIPGSAQEPVAMNMGMGMEGEIGFSVAAGPDPGTFEVTMSGSITDVGGFYGEINGEKITGAERDQMKAAMQTSAPIPSLTMIVDEQGTVLSASALGTDIPLDLFGGDLLGSDVFGFGGSGTGLFGPELPEGIVAVGDVWSTEYHQDILGMSLDAYTTSEVVGAESMDGAPALVIRSVTTLDPITVSLFDMMQEIANLDAATMAAYGVTPADLDDMESALGSGDMTMSMTSEPSVTTTWFDPDSGLTRRVDTEGAVNVAISLRDPVLGSGVISMVMMFTMDAELV